uniref:Uncharacterized protein n=1 Tax=Panagrolaimus sp. PS1159 TaxID=55785 RepID=A0AC35GUU1_9BILA
MQPEFKDPIIIPKAEPKQIKMTDFSDKVQISQSTTAELAKYGWISPRFARNAVISTSQKSLADDEWPLPPPDLSPQQEYSSRDIITTKEIKTTVSESLQTQPTTSLTVETTKPAVSLSFSESLKAQFSHSPSIAPSSPSPKASSSPKLTINSSKPPLPPSSSLRRPLITQFDTEPRRVLSTSWFNETSFEDSLNSSPSVSFTPQNPPNPLISVKADGTTLRFSSLSPP